MTLESMLDHLRRQGDETVDRLWQEAKEKIRGQRAETQHDLARQRQESAAEFADRLDRLDRTSLMEAKRRTEQQRTMSHHHLAERLKELAAANLHTLRDEGYEEVFRLLAGELPPNVVWEEIAVHPDDLPLAAATLPGVTTRTDCRITGGLEVTAKGGRLRIVNTMDKRLERGWQELLPVLLREVLKGVEDDNPAP